MIALTRTRQSLRLVHRVVSFATPSAIALVAIASIQGCASGPGSDDPLPKSVSLAVVPSQASVGQLVTATATPDGPLSDRATIDWITTGGTITTEKNATVARLRFAKPGKYRVTAKLMVDSKEAYRSMVEIPVAGK